MLTQAISNLDAWFDTWKKDGGIYGIIVHQHKENMECTFPDVLTQSCCILAHISLYKKTYEKKWLNKAKKEADFLCNLYLKNTHLFAMSSYEHKPMRGTLVYNGFACLSLLKLYAVFKKDRYLLIAKDCIDNGLLKMFWDKKKQAFWDVDNKLHTLNMGSLAMAALVELSKQTKDKKYLQKYAIMQAEHTLRYQEKKGFLKGAYHYDDYGRSIRFMSLYIAWTMRGLLELYEHTNDKKYHDSLNSASKFLIEKMKDQQTKLFYHRYIRRRIIGIIQLKKFPEWIAASGAVIFALEKLNKQRAHQNLDDTLKELLSHQNPTGGFENTIGYTNMFIPWILKPDPRKKTWRDVIPVAGWNALMLEALVELIPTGSKIPKPNIHFPFKKICSDNYQIIETKNALTIKKENKIVAHYEKTNPMRIYNYMYSLATSEYTTRKINDKSKSSLRLTIYILITILLTVTIYMTLQL